MDIQNQVIVVTGASEGIGAATARLLAQHGAKIALAARSTEKLKIVVEEITAAGGIAFGIKTDLRQTAEVQSLIQQAHQHFGRVDVLINNAGQGVGGTIEHLNLDDYQQVIDLNIFGVLRTMQAVIPIMRTQGGGLIVNISSTISKVSVPGMGGYASTKHALNNLSLTARTELERDNIRVIMVHPRGTATNMAQNSAGYVGNEAQRQAIAAMTRADTPEYVATKILEAIQNEPVEQFMV